MIKILFVCHGNICRSTMAESLMTYLVKQAGRTDIQVASAGTSAEELGNPVHYGTVNKLKEKNIPVVEHRATKLKKEDYEKYDYLIAMDNNNLRNMERILGEDRLKKIYLLKDFTDDTGEVADPWYTHDFETTFKDVYAGCSALLKQI